MLQYLIKFSISLAVLFLFYRVVLRPLTFYQCNRFYLLGYSLLAFFIPFIDISAWYPVGNSQQLNNFVLPINYSIVTNSGAYFVNQPSIKLFWWQQLNSTQWLLIVFSLGALAMLGRLLMQYRSLYSIRRNAVLLDTQEGIQLYETNVKVSPFSFGNAIFFNRQLHTEEELGRIIQHEFVHVRQKHTIDLLTGELLCIVNWFNPFAWFVRYSIRQNLEFIADNKVLNNGLDRKEYQYLLLKAIGAPQYSMGNNFNFSNLKKRIIMMNKIKSSRIHLAKFLFVLPLMAVLFLAFRKKNDGKPVKTKENIIKALAIDTVPALAPPVQDVGVPALAPPMPDAVAPKRAEALQPNKKGYIVTVADNNGECVVIVKDKQRKIVKAVLYSEWNDNKNDYEQKYGGVLMPPPPPPPAIGAPVLAPPAIDGVSPVAAPAPPAKVSINTIPDDMLILVDGVEKTKAEMIAMPGSEIKEINIINSRDAQNLYWLFGEKGKKGVMRITTKHPIKVSDKTAQIQPKDIPGNAGYSLSPKPLIILDGKALPEGFNLNDLDVSSIALMSVLKGKTATDKYGNQGINGVIEITSRDKDQRNEKTHQPKVLWDSSPTEKANADSVMRMKTGDESGSVEVLFKKNGINYTPQNVLIVIDGTALPADAQLNDYVKQENIEQIVVTKDKSAIGKYGDRAKNGVIEVKTKTASLKKSEPASFNFESFQSNGHMEGDGNKTTVKGEFSFTMSSNKMPLLVVNGVAKPSANSFANTDKNKTTRMQFVDEKNAIAQYGADAKNGALLVNIL